MAQEVLQPLVDAMEGAHSRVEESAAQLGLQGIRLSSLESPAPLSVASKSEARGDLFPGIDPSLAGAAALQTLQPGQSPQSKLVLLNYPTRPGARGGHRR